VRLRFEVRDTGIGLSPEAQARLFQPFTQADSSTTRKYGGTGLGLSISKQLVELMGGAVGLRSSEGAGSTFWFTVPLAAGAVRAVSPPTVDAALEGKHVLLVSAHAGLRDVLTAYLEQWGMVVEGATTLWSARTALSDRANRCALPDVVLLDRDASRWYEVVLSELVRSHSPAAHPTPLLVLVPMSAQGAMEQTGEGVAQYLPRPVKHAALHRALAQALAEREAEREAAPVRWSSAPKPAASTVPLARPAAEGDAQVLVVDDGVVNRKLAQLQLQRLGYSVALVNDGREAVAAVAAHTYGLVLMDCHMPEMDGFAATAAIRAAETASGEHLPIVAMTADALQGDRERCLAAGMDDYISKPVTLESVQRILDRWLGTRAQADDAAEEPTAAHGAGEDRDVAQSSARHVVAG